MSKAELVNKLIELTLPLRPSSGNDELFMSVISPDNSINPEDAISPEEKKKLEDEDRKHRNKGYDDVLKSNKNLTLKQKAFVRTNYDRLEKIIDQLVDDSNKKYFPSDLWAKESLEISYTSKFTKEELIELIPKFQGIDGQKFLVNIFVSEFIWSYWEVLEKIFPTMKKQDS